MKREKRKEKRKKEVGHGKKVRTRKNRKRKDKRREGEVKGRWKVEEGRVNKEGDEMGEETRREERRK